MPTGILDKIKFQSANSEQINEPISEPISEPIYDGFFDDGGYVEPDPAPVDAPLKETRRVRAKPGPRGGTAKFRKEVAAEIETYILMAAFPWSLRDEHCAGALSENSAAIATALVDVLSRYPGVLEKLRGSAVFGDAFGLLMALKPVAMAIKAHHFDKTVENEDGTPPVNPDAYPAWGANGPGAGAVGTARTRVFEGMGTATG